MAGDLQMDDGVAVLEQNGGVRAISVAKAGAWPAHLTRPSPGGWCFWRLFGLRGAGIPAKEVLRIGD